ncbi:MAG: cell wall-binding repeat-containing protein [Actinomycetota bacterium]|nr:cell wall-binding repeat-containing protein [Actinomycetota bacterium]
MSRRGTRFVLPAVLAMVAVLAVPVAPARADSVAQPPSPGVIGPHPAPGGVVPAGTVEIAAFLVAQAGVAGAELRIDGVGVPAQRSGSDTYQRIAATAQVAPGDHVAEVALTDRQGAATTRAWRFTASDTAVGRLAGQNRVETAAAISLNLYPQTATAAVLARADDFPDALAGAPLATAVDGPLLLSGAERLADATAGELRRVLPPGATVYLLGGRSALSEQVAADVQAIGLNPQRVAGTDRFGTAAAASAVLPAGDAAVVASGFSFPDALAASSPAAIGGMPIVLTAPDSLPPATREFLAARNYPVVYVVGGTAVVNDQVAAELDQLAGEVHRLAGPSRFDTAAVIAGAFFASPQTVAVASGERFPDALAGGPHAAAHGAPLMLTPHHNLARPQVDQLATWRPAAGVVYGGAAAVADTAAGDIRRASLDAGGPREVSLSPGPGDEINTLDTLQIDFDRAVDLNQSSVFVTLNGHEVYGSLAHGDFANSIVFRAGALPIAAQANHAYPVRVTAAAFDGSGWRHLEYDLVFRKLELSRGDQGPAVRDLQQRLSDLGYWLPTPDGTFGSATVQAVYAFQKHEGLQRTGSVDAATRQRLQTAARPVPRHQRSGRYVEIDKPRQIMFIVQDGRVLHTFAVSSGNGEYYNEGGSSGYAITPEGTFTFFRQIDGMRESHLGRLWRPKYFTDRGHAIHGSTNVPPYPASHGCVRLIYPAIDFIWDAGLVPLGTRLYVY